MVVMKKLCESRSERLFDEGCEASGRGDLTKAREKFLASSALVPGALTLCNLGVIHERLGEFDAAVKCYARACKVEKRDPIPRVNLGDALVRQNRFVEASKAYTSALKLRVEEPWLCLNNLGVSYEKTGDKKRAMACYKKAIEIKPQYDLAQQNYLRMVKDKQKSRKRAKAVPVEDTDEKKTQEKLPESPVVQDKRQSMSGTHAAPAEEKKDEKLTVVKAKHQSKIRANTVPAEAKKEEKLPEMTVFKEPPSMNRAHAAPADDIDEGKEDGKVAVVKEKHQPVIRSNAVPADDKKEENLPEMTMFKDPPSMNRTHAAHADDTDDEKEEEKLAVVKEKHQPVIRANAIPANEKKEEKLPEVTVVKDEPQSATRPLATPAKDDEEKQKVAESTVVDEILQPVIWAETIPSEILYEEKEVATTALPEKYDDGEEKEEEAYFDGSEISRESRDGKQKKAPCASCVCGGPSGDDVIGWWFGSSSSGVSRRRR